MEPTYPPKLRPGSHLRVVAPALSRAMVTRGNDNAAVAERTFAGLGLTLSFGDHVDECDRYHSSTIASRVADLHAAFADPEVDGILTVIGGHNSNELLPHLDFDLIRANPKVFCGYSDITALQNAILATTGLVTYAGPHWSSFGMVHHFDQTRDWFRQCLMTDEPVVVTPQPWFTDDLWFLDQENRTTVDTDGWWVLQPGEASGRTVGGNLCTLNLLQGTQWMPSLAGCVVLVEDDLRSNPAEFRRDLTSLLQQPGADDIRGLVIGRFQQASEVEREDVVAAVEAAGVPADLPVVANVDFGHTNPLMTFPVGGQIEVRAGEQPRLVLTEH